MGSAPYFLQNSAFRADEDMKAIKSHADILVLRVGRDTIAYIPVVKVRSSRLARGHRDNSVLVTAQLLVDQRDCIGILDQEGCDAGYKCINLLVETPIDRVFWDRGRVQLDILFHTRQKFGAVEDRGAVFHPVQVFGVDPLNIRDDEHVGLFVGITFSTESEAELILGGIGDLLCYCVQLFHGFWHLSHAVLCQDVGTHEECLDVKELWNQVRLAADGRGSFLGDGEQGLGLVPLGQIGGEIL